MSNVSAALSARHGSPPRQDRDVDVSAGRLPRATSAVTAVLLLINLGFVGVLGMLSGLLAGDWDRLTFALGGREIVLDRGIIGPVALPFILTSSLVFTAWIFVALLRPLRQIHAGLRAGSETPFASLLSQPTELGEIARGVAASLRQRHLMERELAIRERLENRLRDSESALAALRAERERFLQNLHDGLIQSLFALGLKMENLASSLQPMNPEAADSLRLAIGEINRLLDDLRASLHQAVETIPLNLRLSAALKNLVESFQGLGVEYELSCQSVGEERLDPTQTAEIIAICSEALMNTLRHAQASRVFVQLEMNQNAIKLRISDDGQGFPESLVEGLGLHGMRQRATRLRGRLQLTNQTGRGAQVLLEIPLVPVPPTSALR